MEKISKEQINILNSLKCERLSSNEKNRELIESFNCQRGQSLVLTLKNEAWNEDNSCSKAYYVIRDENTIYLFFSLQCGSLFNPLDEKQMKKKEKLGKKLIRLLDVNYIDEEERQKAAFILKRFVTENNISIDELKAEIIPTLLSRVRDMNIEGNEKIIRVGETFSGVELIHFCKNDNSNNDWEKLGLNVKNRTMGEILFWYFIAPKVDEVRKIIGCQYLFLFAADASKDGTLINYYNLLNFKQPTNVGTNKPYYDFCCKFMCQKVDELKEKRDLFFTDFSENEKSDIV